MAFISGPSAVQPRTLGQVGHQKLHLVSQDAPVSQDEIFPEAGYVRGKKERHACLLRRAVTLAMVARTAGSHHIHPDIPALLAQRDDVLTGEINLCEMVAAISADIPVSGKQLAVAQARAQIERVDVRYATRADDAVDRDDRLFTGDGIVTTVENSHSCPRFPAHFFRRIVDHRLFKRNPGLGQALSRKLQDLH